MEIRASELMSGKKIPFYVRHGDITERRFLQWNKKRTQYEIVPESNMKYAFWYGGSLFSIVRKMNSQTGKYDTAIDDSKEWENTTGATVDWKKKVKKMFRT